MPISIHTSNASLIAQSNTSRTQSALSTSLTRLSAGLKVNSADHMPQQAMTYRPSLSTAFGAVNNTMYATESASSTLDQASDLVVRAKVLMTNARGPDAPRGEINAELSKIKGALAELTQSTVNGESWLNASLSNPGIKTLVTSATTGSSGATSVKTAELDTRQLTLYSDSNTDDGILTRSNGGYHLLSSASTSSSSTEISISDTTTAEEFDGMGAALDSILSGLQSAQQNLGTVRGKIGDIGSQIAEQALSSTGKSLTPIDSFDAANEKARLALEEIKKQMNVPAMNQRNNNSALASLLR